MPPTGNGAWPGRAEAVHKNTQHKPACVEEALTKDLAIHLGQECACSRFIPFVIMHEFEGLLFSDCTAFAKAIGRAELEPEFRKIRDDFNTPEDINDSQETCPSQRVKGLIPGYEKPLLGVLAALEIGLVRIRAECPHFDAWLQQIELLLG